jgi:hypothetical protein
VRAPGLPPRESAQLLRGRQRAETLQQSFDQVDLSLRERHVDPDAARREPMTVRRLDHVAASGARQVGVVEHDTPSSGRKLVLERLGKLAQRSSTLVAVEADVTSGDVLVGDPALPRSGDAHDDNHLRVIQRSRSFDPSRTRCAERASEGYAFTLIEVESRSAGRGTGGLRATRTGDRDHCRGHVEQPRERDLGRSDAARFRDEAQRFQAAEATGAARQAESER